MKYKLLRELPFMRVGTVFYKRSWAEGGGYGVDLGDNEYGVCNGIFVFEDHEN